MRLAAGVAVVLGRHCVPSTEWAFGSTCAGGSGRELLILMETWRVITVQEAQPVPTQALPEGRYLPEREGHRVWWCETGPPGGAPVLVIHGGPGGRTRWAPFSWFAGLPVRCIAFDQRGCGRSLPAGRLQSNTLAHLVDDIEQLRVALQLPAWGIVAGSWGALVALAYAAAHPQRVRGLLLRSPFLGADAEVARFFEPWPRWLGAAGAAWLGAAEPADPLTLLQASTVAQPGAAPVAPARVALAWQAFEAAQGQAGGLRARLEARFNVPEAGVESADALPPALAVQLHYLQQHCFVRPGQLDAWLALLDGVLATRPVSLVHGLADAVCHPSVSAALSARWPHAALRWVDGAGHDMDAPALGQALTEAATQWVAALAPA